jgi:GcrA cell cycle regulator
MSWTDERVETLKKMWGEGQSASQIAKELGGVTRNAVIGKVHRLGLSNRTVGATPAATPAKAKVDPVADSPAFVHVAPPQPTAKPARVVDMAKAKAARAPEPEPKPAAPVEAVVEEDEDENDNVPALSSAPGSYARRAIIPAGQPLPPQPSANEISPEALATVREIEKTARKLTLMELTERTCKWPVGDPATPDFWFCGLPTQQGKPYCDAHVGVAFQPMSARRDRRR